MNIADSLRKERLLSEQALLNMHCSLMHKEPEKESKKDIEIIKAFFKTANGSQIPISGELDSDKGLLKFTDQKFYEAITNLIGSHIPGSLLKIGEKEWSVLGIKKYSPTEFVIDFDQSRLVREEKETNVEKIDESKVQSLVFDKSKFSKSEALSWAKKHGFKSPKIDEKENTYRIRQDSPRKFKRFRTMEFKPGVQAVLGIEERYEGMGNKFIEEMKKSGLLKEAVVDAPTAQEKSVAVQADIAVAKGDLPKIDPNVGQTNIPKEQPKEPNLEPTDTAQPAASTDASTEPADGEEAPKKEESEQEKDLTSVLSAMDLAEYFLNKMNNGSMMEMDDAEKAKIKAMKEYVELSKKSLKDMKESCAKRRQV